jgi:CheY-like chemotaxis protein
MPFSAAQTAMTESKALDALFPSPRRVVLCAMFHEPCRWWGIPELAGRAGLLPASLRTHMGALRNAGIIREKIDGGRAWYQANCGCPVYAELQSLIGKLSPRTDRVETILIVEDQPATARITGILLESWGYCVLEAHSGAEAIRIFEQHRAAVHLVLTDMIMPGLTGPQLAAELLRRDPRLRVVFMSGYASDVGPDTAFLAKPFNPASLSRTIRRALDRAPASRRPAMRKLIANS